MGKCFLSALKVQLLQHVLKHHSLTFIILLQTLRYGQSLWHKCKSVLEGVQRVNKCVV